MNLKRIQKSKNIGLMYNMISEAYFAIEKYQESLENINLAIRNISSEPIFYQRRAKCYLKLGNLNEAKKDYDSCVDNSSNLNSKIYNLFNRATFNNDYMKLPIKSLLDFTEIINILNLKNSNDFINQEERKKLLTLAYQGRSSILMNLKFSYDACEDYKMLCDLDHCEKL